ncbi:MAG: hypothetical protein HC924_09660 [Synechococcaceae cyanobacterium SM2_3_2]|nr:hypothetical protein [Synechococcaceae cyanobacterium SM2_3_2]
MEENTQQVSTHKFYAIVDHSESVDITQRFQMIGCRITEVSAPHEHSRNGHTYLKSAVVDPQDPSLLQVTYHVQGKGVRTVAGIVVDRLGRGWIDADFTVTGIPLE